uniref:Uncharacterized protein n=1 Tax=Rhizophora mucronata TaxID=61149 RepID=A0A2P2Q4X0_RHIMU
MSRQNVCQHLCLQEYILNSLAIRIYNYKGH